MTSSFQSSLSSVSAATAETTEDTTAMITAINMMTSPPANTINIVLPLFLKKDVRFLSRIKLLYHFLRKSTTIKTSRKNTIRKNEY